MRINKTLSGYMTVEAAFIIPWVVFILVWLIYLGYFQYDKCLLFQDNYTVVAQVSGRNGSVSEKQNWISEMISSSAKRKYMGARNIQMQGTVSEHKVVVDSSLRVEHPLTNHSGMIPHSNWNVSDHITGDNIYFSKRLRGFRTLERVIGG